MKEKRKWKVFSSLRSKLPIEKIKSIKIARLVQHKVPTPAEIDCLNCRVPVTGSYCQACGQPVDTVRYSAKGLTEEFAREFRKLDLAGIVVTFGQLITRPGMFVREYLAGKRVGYLTPVKYFFYSFLLQVTVALIIHSLTGGNTSLLTKHTDINSQIIDVFATIFWGFGWWALYRRSGLNIIENIVAAIYFTAQGFMFTFLLRLIFVPIVQYFPTAITTFSIVDVSVSLLYSYFFSWRLFREKRWRVFAKQTFLSLAYAIVLVILALITIFAQGRQGLLETSAR